MHHLTQLCCLLSGFTLSLAAQQDPGSPRAERCGDRVVVAAKNHRAEFGTTTRSFVHEDAAMSWRPTRFGRSGGPWSAFDETLPAIDGSGAVDFAHAVCRERYQPQANGIELSFVFETLPAGSGDLVVQLVVATALPCVGAGPDGLYFGTSKHRGVPWGGVTGIAADGACAPGTITSDGATIELRLPAAFVQHAALPLVLDPMIGTNSVVAASFSSHPDVATYNTLTNGGYCVWQQSSGSAIWARSLSATGAPQGTAIPLAATGSAPVVTSIPAQGQFVSAFVQSGNITGRAISNSGVKLLCSSPAPTPRKSPISAARSPTSTTR